MSAIVSLVVQLLGSIVLAGWATAALAAAGKGAPRPTFNLWVGGFNVRRGHANIYAALRRVDNVGVIGLQEVSNRFGVNGPAKLHDAARKLGFGVIQGHGTASELAIAWDNAVFRLIRQRQVFCMHGIRKISPDRWLLLGFFAHRQTGIRFCLIDTHFIAWAYSSKPWLRPRWWAHAMVLAATVAYVRHVRGLPVFVVGDFNRKWYVKQGQKSVIRGLLNGTDNWYDQNLYAPHPTVKPTGETSGPRYDSDHQFTAARYQVAKPWPKKRTHDRTKEAA